MHVKFLSQSLAQNKHLSYIFTNIVVLLVLKQSYIQEVNLSYVVGKTDNHRILPSWCLGEGKKNVLEAQMSLCLSFFRERQGASQRW